MQGQARDPCRTSPIPRLALCSKQSSALAWRLPSLFVKGIWGSSVKSNKIAAMDKQTSKTLEEALKLPPKARAALAGSLIESLDEPVEEGIDEAWAKEIAQRVEDLDSRKAKTIPWPQARQRILSR
jgi:putative addiction module component (TIGR02574 family)